MGSVQTAAANTAVCDEFTILTPNAMLGYGYNSDHFWYGITKYRPAAIIVDSGSTDGGPYKLGLNKMTCGRGSYVRDLEPILAACFHHKIKVMISSVGGDGSTKHVTEMLDIVSGIAKQKGYSFKIATIDAGMDRGMIKDRIKAHRVSPCGPVNTLLPEDVDSAVDVVAQMGAEPYIAALRGDPDIILGGRSYDPAPFAAFCLSRGVQDGVAWHMGKIMECGGICALPKGRSMIATIRHDSFDLTPLSPEERCTPLSVASHTLYEKTRPDRLPGPGGVLSLDNARYEQVTEKTCRVSGAEFLKTPYQVKLEGVTHLGYRTIFIGGIRDPILIGQIDDFLERVRKYTQNLFPELDKSENCRLIYHVYGKDAVMGPLETSRGVGHEIAVLGEVVAPSQEMSHTIANNTRASILHFPYAGQMATTGNFASPLSPHEQEAGPVFKFSLYHLVDLERGEEVSLFPVTYHEVQSIKDAADPVPTIDANKVRELDSGTLAPLSYKDIPDGPAKLSDVARIIRSKNSGPFELTLDVMFDSPAAYRRVKEADILTNTVICKIYRVTRNEIITNMYFDPAQAWKCTIKRLWAQGSVGERDTLGTQQHAPLLDIDVPAASNAASVPGVGSIAGPAPDRRGFTALDIVREIWGEVGLPEASLSSLSLPGSDTQDAPALPSSYKIGAIAQSTIALSALAAAQVYAILNQCPTPPVRVPLQHSVVEFKSERLYRIDGKPPPSPWGPIGGLHKTADGYVRIHDSFPNHCFGALELLGLPSTASRSEVSEKTSQWASIDLESTGVLEQKLALYALRSYQQWDMLPQSGAIDNIPISLRKVAPGPVGLPSSLTPGKDRCLRGLRVVEMSRVIAAPLAGKTLAAHGADVLWVTSPFLPDLPSLDREFSRGKRTVQLAVSREEDLEQLKELLRTADVFIQGFRPGSLAKYGLSAKEIAATNPGIICANMSAFGPKGPWSGRRGFDSLVQTCSGMNVSEAEHFGAGEAARPTPCQALDHGAGYLLAAGISSALCRRASEGGSWQVDVSLAGVMKYLRSLGQFPGQTGFNCRDYERAEDVEGYLETRESEFGQMEYVKHSVQIDGCEPGWDIMPRSLGSDEPEWLEEQREE